MRSMEARIRETFQGTEVYADRLPKDFQRPSFSLELIENGMSDVNQFLVKRTVVVLITIFEEVNAFYDSSRENLNARQDQVLALFSKPLQADGRTLLPSAQKGEGTPAYNEVAVQFEWMDSRPGYVDKDTAPESESGVPLMEHYTMLVGTTPPAEREKE